jgi:simple sugar transport system permease protein
MDAIMTMAFLGAILRVATPYMFASLAGVVSERVGIANLALEGQMLSAAATGALVAGYSGSVWLGAGIGIAVGALLGVVLAVIVLELHADAIITGIGINLLASGGTAFAVFTLLDDKGGTTGLESGALPTIEIPGLASIPLIGDVLSGQNLMTYLALAALPVVAWLLYRSRFGVHLRAVGESPAAAESVGLRVGAVQYAALAVSGALAGMGGVFLSMGAVSFFVRDMTAGRGYIALAAVFLGGVRPLGAFLAALVFGFSEALAIQLGSTGVPTQLVTAIPYVLTLLALAWFAGRRTVRVAAHSTRPKASTIAAR